MEHNKDEAVRCIEIAQRHIAQDNFAAALKFTKKSLALYPTPTAELLLTRLEARGSAEAKPAPASASSHRSTSEPQLRQRTGKGAATREPPATPSTQREYTREQVVAVKRIHDCGEDYYAILSLEKTATDADIKKSYRKLALQFHPDKNGAPGADEAFKMISKAFTILSDGDKRAHYDRYGSDPGTRMGGGGGGGGGFGGGASPFGQGFGYEQEVSPEELFNMFFGGGGGGGGAGPFFASSFGPNVRMHQFGGRPARGAFRRPGANQRPENNSILTTLFALLPLLFVLLPLLTSFLSSVFVNFGTGYSTPEPSFRFVPTHHQPVQRFTREYAVPYYVNQREFDAAFADNPRRLNNFERTVNARFTNHLQEQCQREIETKRRKIHEAQGWLGLMTDEAKLRDAQAMAMPSCEKLKEMHRGSG
ncbi:Chaperone protein dnaJ [Tieghemiomyces parasiticus]|uniref:Chaperone protein dnaJ n=1 Tax=Tieghemiomyces parasiticus TaxID=78921 RepID=A0A9W8DP79_9FUNG|nr:Chaperone protein dnaJ [Tieghemiomyces parasiticus]